MTKPRSKFSRGPGDSFDDPKKEVFAKAWARTGLLRTACEEAGIAAPTGSKWRGHPEMELRIRELRAGSETYVGVSLSYIINQLRMNAENAAAAFKFKEATEALALMAKLMANGDLARSGNTGLPDDVGDLTPEQLAERRARAFPSPALPADTREMIETEDGVFEPEDEDEDYEYEQGEDDGDYGAREIVYPEDAPDRPLTNAYRSLIEQPFEGDGAE